jgi:hypothetical protein
MISGLPVASSQKLKIVINSCDRVWFSSNFMKKKIVMKKCKSLSEYLTHGWLEFQKSHFLSKIARIISNEKLIGDFYRNFRTVFNYFLMMIMWEIFKINFKGCVILMFKYVQQCKYHEFPMTCELVVVFFFEELCVCRIRPVVWCCLC